MVDNHIDLLSTLSGFDFKIIPQKLVLFKDDQSKFVLFKDDQSFSKTLGKSFLVS